MYKIVMGNDSIVMNEKELKEYLKEYQEQGYSLDYEYEKDKIIYTIEKENDKIVVVVKPLIESYSVVIEKDEDTYKFNTFSYYDYYKVLKDYKDKYEVIEQDIIPYEYEEHVFLDKENNKVIRIKLYIDWIEV